MTDTAADITAALDSLDGSNIASITISDNGAVGASVAQLTSDATAVGKLANASGTPYQLAISDTAANVQADLATLEADVAHIASVTLTSGTVVVSVSTFTADQGVLNKIGGGFYISDSAANISASLNALNDANINAISVSDNGAVVATVAQLSSDATAIGKLANASGTPYQLAISDTAANVQADLANSGGRSRAHRLGHFDKRNGRRLRIDVHRRSGRAQQDRRRVLHFGQCGEHIGEPQRAQRRQHQCDQHLRQWRGRRHGRSIVERRDGDRQAGERQRDALPARDPGHRGQCRGRLIDPQRRFARSLDHGDERQRDLERGRRRERADLLGNGLGDEPHHRRGACLRRRLQPGRRFDDGDNGRTFRFR